MAIVCCGNKSSRSEVFRKKGVLRHFAKLTGKHLCQNLFFNKVASEFIDDINVGVREQRISN